MSAGEGRKLLFVRIGQHEPLFDEQTLQVFAEGVGTRIEWMARLPTPLRTPLG